MLFLIDGYNITRRDPASRDLPLEAQRDALVARLRARGREMLGAGRIVVVFDAREGAAGTPTHTAPVEVVYARGCSADDEIVRIAAGARGKVVVVSDDRELAERVAAHSTGAEQRASACCFDSAGRGASRKGPKPAPPRNVGVPRGANAITEELKKLWLDEEDK